MLQVGLSYIPLLRTACHSSSDFLTGYSILFWLLLLKRDPRKGIVGIDLSAAARAKGEIAL